MSDLYGGSVDTQHSGNPVLAGLLRGQKEHHRKFYERKSVKELERLAHDHRTFDRGIAGEVLKKKKQVQAKKLKSRMTKDKTDFEKARKELRKVVGTKDRKVTKAQFERARTKLKEPTKAQQKASPQSAKLGRKIVGTKRYKKDKSA